LAVATGGIGVDEEEQGGVVEGDAAVVLQAGQGRSGYSQWHERGTEERECTRRRRGSHLVAGLCAKVPLHRWCTARGQGPDGHGLVHGLALLHQQAHLRPKCRKRQRWVG
jgi:hypothetical protein